MQRQEVEIANAARSAIHDFSGSQQDHKPSAQVAQMIAEVVKKSKVVSKSVQG